MELHRINPSTAPPREQQAYLHSLDALRGVAALIVVVYHWRHFFESTNYKVDFELNQFPFYALLAPFYQSGFKAVDLFFCLSGFIFYWLYAKNISDGRMSFSKFIVNRISRLYPLHILTLFLVAFGQTLLRYQFETTLVTQHNDLYHFVLQLLFISAWGMEVDDSFNTPIWSVSVEMLLYLVFFVACWMRYTHVIAIVAFSFVGILLIAVDESNIGRGFLSFFIGGITCVVYSTLKGGGVSSRLLICGGITLLLVWILVWICQIDERIRIGSYSLYNMITVGKPFLFMGKDLIGAACLLIDAYCLQLFLFPATVLWFALADVFICNVLKPFSYLGAISYSIYLLHFPLQIAIYFALRLLGYSADIFYGNLPFVLFFPTLILLSAASYNFFERPSQTYVRTLYQRYISTKISTSDRIN